MELKGILSQRRGLLGLALRGILGQLGVKVSLGSFQAVFGIFEDTQLVFDEVVEGLDQDGPGACNVTENGLKVLFGAIAKPRGSEQGVIMIEDGLSVVRRRWEGKVSEAVKLLAKGTKSVGKLGELLDIVFQPSFDNIELGNEVDGCGAKGG